MTSSGASLESLSTSQQRTLNARAAFSRRFANPEERTAYYRALGKKSAQGRVVLRASEAAALTEAARLLGQLAERLAVAKEAEISA